MKGERTHQV